MNQIKTYIINLPKDLDRRESVLQETQQFPNLEIEIVKAVYGKELTDLERESLFDGKKYRQYYGRSVLPGEIGCTLSHRVCYKHLLDSGWQSSAIVSNGINLSHRFSKINVRIVLKGGCRIPGLNVV